MGCVMVCVMVCVLLRVRAACRCWLVHSTCVPLQSSFVSTHLPHPPPFLFLYFHHGATRGQVEMFAFKEFFPLYAEYLHKSFYHDLPTALTKILGMYRIYCTPSTGGMRSGPGGGGREGVVGFEYRLSLLREQRVCVCVVWCGDTD